jgi:hypothetical protein
MRRYKKGEGELDRIAKFLKKDGRFKICCNEKDNPS